MGPFLEAQAYAGTHEPHPATETQNDLTIKSGIPGLVHPKKTEIC